MFGSYIGRPAALFLSLKGERATEQRGGRTHKEHRGASWASRRHHHRGAWRCAQRSEPGLRASKAVRRHHPIIVGRGDARRDHSGDHGTIKGSYTFAPPRQGTPTGAPRARTLPGLQRKTQRPSPLRGRQLKAKAPARASAARRSSPRLKTPTGAPHARTFVGPLRPSAAEAFPHLPPLPSPARRRMRKRASRGGACGAWVKRILRGVSLVPPPPLPPAPAPPLPPLPPPPARTNPRSRQQPSPRNAHPRQDP